MKNEKMRMIDAGDLRRAGEQGGLSLGANISCQDRRLTWGNVIY